MGRPERPLRQDGSPVRELAYWLRDLRNQSGLTYYQLATKSTFSRATLQEALSGKRLPTWQVTQAIVGACGGDVDLWHTYWAQIRRALDRDAPLETVVSVIPPWAVADTPTQDQSRSVPLPGDELKERETQAARHTTRLRQRPGVWASTGGGALVVAGVLTGVLLAGSSSPLGTHFPNPNHHPKAPLINPVARTHTEQEFNPNGVPTFAHLDASGAGTPVAYGQYVQVSCKVYSTIVKSTKPDGYWYRLASLPWDNHYYAVSNTFGNGDKLNHPPYTHNTDWRVPDCK